MKGRLLFGVFFGLCFLLAYDVGAAIAPVQYTPQAVVVDCYERVEIDMLNEESHAATCELVNTQEAVKLNADRFYRTTPPRWRALNKDAIPDITGKLFIYMQPKSLYRSYTSSGGLAGR